MSASACRRRPRRRSSSCGGRPGGGRARCRLRWAGPPRRSGGCSGGMAAHAPSASPGRRRIGMSTPRSGELVHLDIKKLGRFWQVGKRVLGDGSTEARAPAGATPTSPSMTTPATPPSSCAPASTPPTASAFTADVIAAYAQRGTPIQRILTDNGSGYRSAALRRRCSPTTASATSAPAPTRPGRTAKPKRSSASSNANGPTPSSTPPAATAPKPSQAGCAGTTTTDHTAASAATHPSPASHTLRGPTLAPGQSPHRAASCGWPERPLVAGRA